jgi:hypothetical protein
MQKGLFATKFFQTLILLIIIVPTLFFIYFGITFWDAPVGKDLVSKIWIGALFVEVFIYVWSVIMAFIKIFTANPKAKFWIFAPLIAFVLLFVTLFGRGYIQDYNRCYDTAEKSCEPGLNN